MSSYELLVQLPIECGRDLDRPVVGAGFGADGGADTIRPVRGVRAVDEGLQLVEIDLDQLVVQSTVIGSQICGRPKSAASAIASRPVDLRYIAMLWS